MYFGEMNEYHKADLPGIGLKYEHTTSVHYAQFLVDLFKFLNHIVHMYVYRHM